MRKDVNGVISLESISLAITRMYRRQVPPLERRALVCVLFRD
jgi:hypothetical protein